MMDQALIPTIAALLGAIIGGLLSVLASWLAQRVQARAQWMSQEILRRQQLYSEFIEAAARCYADALQRNEPNTAALSRLYGEIGRMRLHSSALVIKEAMASHTRFWRPTPPLTVRRSKSEICWHRTPSTCSPTLATRAEWS
jgi:hypothetical protein